MHLTLALESKGDIIAEQSLTRARVIVKNFNEDALEAWKAACGMVLKGTIGLTGLRVVRTHVHGFVNSFHQLHPPYTGPMSHEAQVLEME